jgi:hypothetical protein
LITDIDIYSRLHSRQKCSQHRNIQRRIMKTYGMACCSDDGVDDILSAGLSGCVHAHRQFLVQERAAVHSFNAT